MALIHYPRGPWQTKNLHPVQMYDNYLFYFQ